MSAHLYIHIQTDEISNKKLKDIFQTYINSEFFDYSTIKQRTYENEKKNSKLLQETPNIKVGPISNLKAALSKEQEKFIPGQLNVFQKRIGNEPTKINNRLIKNIKQDIKTSSNNSIYNNDELHIEKSLRFLEIYKGKKAFTVSW